jgi:hypothetical protein
MVVNSPPRYSVGPLRRRLRTFPLTATGLQGKAVPVPASSATTVPPAAYTTPPETCREK